MSAAWRCSWGHRNRDVRGSRSTLVILLCPWKKRLTALSLVGFPKAVAYRGFLKGAAIQPQSNMLREIFFSIGKKRFLR